MNMIYIGKCLQNYHWLYWYGITRIVLCMRPANERRCYVVTSPLIGWAHAQKCHLHMVGFQAEWHVRPDFKSNLLVNISYHHPETKFSRDGRIDTRGGQTDGQTDRLIWIYTKTSFNVVVCAEFCSDIIFNNGVTTIFSRIWIMIEKSSAKCAPDSEFTKDIQYLAGKLWGLYVWYIVSSISRWKSISLDFNIFHIITDRRTKSSTTGLISYIITGNDNQLFQLPENCVQSSPQ